MKTTDFEFKCVDRDRPGHHSLNFDASCMSGDNMAWTAMNCDVLNDAPTCLSVPTSKSVAIWL